MPCSLVGIYQCTYVSKDRASSIFYLETSLTIYQSAGRHIQENLNLCVCVYVCVCMYTYVCMYGMDTNMWQNDSRIRNMSQT
jgi:hypothetical protein